MAELPLYELLHIKKGVTAVIGSGGKTTLLQVLAKQLPGKVMLCTTSFFYPFRDTAFLSISDITEEKEELMLRGLYAENRVVCNGEMAGNGKLGRPLLPFEKLKTLADYVLVEADVSRGYPLKAHADREPDFPEYKDDVICVTGASGFMKPVRDVVHHPDVFRLLTGCAEDADARPELVAKAAVNEKLAKTFFINQVESREDLALAERFVNATDLPGIVVGSLHQNVYKRYA